MKAKGIVFSVFNSEKLSIKAKSYPDLIETFFGKHWLEAMGIPPNNTDILQPNFHWETDTGKIINPEKIYRHGDFKLRFDDKMIYVDEQLPDGKDTHVIINTESGAVSVKKYPYPLAEYKIDIPEKLIIQIEKEKTSIKGKKYLIIKYQLKWGKHAIFLYDNEKLVDMYIDTRTFINHTNKCIHVLDISEETEDL